MRSLSILLILSSTSLSAQNARGIINHYLDTVSNGNIENWNKIKSVYTESESYHSQNEFEQKVSLLKQEKLNFNKYYRVPPYNDKYEIYDDSSFTKPVSTFYYLKDKTVILMGNNPPMIKVPPIRDEFYSIHVPVKISKLMNKSKSIELLGVKEFLSDGFSCYEIKITTKGRGYVLFINTKTFLLEYWNDREDEDLSILTKFYHYKKVDDFLIPMSDSMIKNGFTYFSNTTKTYLINSVIDPEVFNYKGN